MASLGVVEGPPAVAMSRSNRREIEVPQSRKRQSKSKAKAPKNGSQGKPSRRSYWGTLFAVVSPVSALLGFLIGVYFNWWISLSAEPSISLDKAGQYATLIKISNEGRIPAHNLRFSCGYGAGGGTTRIDGVLDTASMNVAPARSLGYKQAITRSCNVPLVSIGGNDRLAFIVEYEWPWIKWPTEERFVFSVAKGPEGYALVPDLLP